MDNNKPPKKKVLAYVVTTPDGTELISKNRHDFVSHIDTKDGCEYSVDGGSDYLRLVYDKDKGYVDVLTVDILSPLEVREKYLFWGTHGKDGKQEYRQIPLGEMSDNHIKNCIRHCGHYMDFDYLITMREILIKRGC